MTIITNPLSAFVKKGLILTGLHGQKKTNKLVEEPLVDNALNEKSVDSDPSKGNIEVGKSARHYYVLHSRGRRMASLVTFCVFVTVLLVTGIGLIGGLYLYQEASHPSNLRFSCQMPYSLVQAITALKHKHKERVQAGIEKGLSSGPLSEAFFKVEYEIDPNNRFERIQVPSIGKGRRGLFINDFYTNKTGIVDFERNRCFIMTLDSSVVLPPQGLKEFAQKIERNSYEKIDSHVLKKRMRVVYPAIRDFRTVGIVIDRECRNIPTYPLQPMSLPALVKRSVEEDNYVHFIELAGKGVLDIQIME